MTEMSGPALPSAVIVAARDAAKAYLRSSGDGEDALIGALAASALTLGEAFTGSAWIAREWIEVVAASRTWQRIAAAPVVAITAVEGLTAEGAAFALPGESYAIDIDAAGEGWVRMVAPVDAVRLRVTLSAGAAAGWADLPPPLAQGTVLLIAHLFEHRERDASPPAAVSALWRPWRRMRLSAGRRAA